MKCFKFWMLLTLVALISVGFSSCTRVDSSEVGIKFNKLSLTDQGKLDASTVTGYIVYNPITTSIYTYPTYVQRVDYKPFSVNTKDAAVFTMDPILAYYLNRSKAVDVFFKYRKNLKDIQEGYMRTVIYNAYRICANKYTSDELMANRVSFEDDVKIMLDSTLNTEGFIVTEFTSQITPPRSLEDAINAKNKAIQESLKAKNEVEKAKAEAEIAVAKAEGEAKAMKVKADAEAYYNRTISASLSQMIVQEDFIEKWDGKLPSYMMGNSSNVMKVLP